MHRHRPAAGIENELASAVYPTLRSVAAPDDAVFFVEGLALAQNFMGEISAHGRAVAGMKQIPPAVHCALVRTVDAEDFIQDFRARPHAGLDIQAVAAQSSNFLRISQQFLAFAHSPVRFNVLGDIRCDSQYANDFAVGAVDRVFAIVDPAQGSILSSQLLVFIHAPSFGKRSALQLVSRVGDGLRVNVVIGLTHELSSLLCRFGKAGQTPARGQNHMIRILQENVVVGIFDKGLEAGDQNRIAGLTQLPNVFQPQIELGRAVTRVSFREARLQAANPPVSMTDTQVHRAGDVSAVLGKQGFGEAGIRGVDAILRLDSCGEKFLATETEQGFNIFAGGKELRRELQSKAESYV